MLKQTVNKNNIHVPVGVSSFATSSNDLNTNQRLLRHVISRDYITHEFRVIPKQLILQFFRCSKILGEADKQENLQKKCSENSRSQIVFRTDIFRN